MYKRQTVSRAISGKGRIGAATRKSCLLYTSSLESAAKAIATQHEDTCALVDNNKHFTAPAKRLSETSDRLEEHVASCADIAAQMKRCV